MNGLLSNLASRLVVKGSLSVTDAHGVERHFGDGTGDPVHVVIKKHGTELAIALDPGLAFPEAYMNGNVEIVEGNLLDLLHIVYQSGDIFGTQTLAMRISERVRVLTRRLQQLNFPGRSRRNVQRHYDLSGELYRLFLDDDLQYSCAYFSDPGMSLEAAQRAKKDHIAAKLDLRDGQKVLDIGCGWGGLGLYIARQFNVDVLGVTLSTEQHAVAQSRKTEAGLSDRLDFRMADYRSLKGPFDRIVSVGMFEHVGINHFHRFFETCAKILADDGVMLIHTIGRTLGPTATAPFIRKYIFPGGYIPALSEVMPAIEQSGLVTTDVEILRLHYAETLKHWRERFVQHWDEAVALYDERFARMWEFYLAASEASFRWQDMVNFQIQLAKQRETLPITRDYMLQREAALARALLSKNISYAAE